MRDENLIIGNVYFMVTYPDVSLSKPIIITYEYIGKNRLDEPAENIGYVYLFKYLPAFRYENHEECLRPDEVPTMFTEAQLEKLGDIKDCLRNCPKFDSELREQFSQGW